MNCPYCRDNLGISKDVKLSACHKCLSWQHDECRREHKRCVVCSTEDIRLDYGAVTMPIKPALIDSEFKSGDRVYFRTSGDGSWIVTEINGENLRLSMHHNEIGFRKASASRYELITEDEYFKRIYSMLGLILLIIVIIATACVIYKLL